MAGKVKEICMKCMLFTKNIKREELSNAKKIGMLLIMGCMAVTMTAGSIQPVQAAWKKSGTHWWNTNESARGYSVGWEKIKGSWYYFDQDGWMQTGWKKLDNKWYYLNTSGAMQTGWKKLDNKWYYLNEGGAMQTGWKKIDGSWYYLDSKQNGAMVTGYIQLGNDAYVLHEDGKMAFNEWINGYYYGSDGKKTLSKSWMEGHLFENNLQEERKKEWDYSETINLLLKKIQSYEKKAEPDTLKIGEFYLSLRIVEALEQWDVYNITYYSDLEIMRVSREDYEGCDAYYHMTKEEVKELWDSIDSEETVTTRKIDKTMVEKIEIVKYENMNRLVEQITKEEAIGEICETLNNMQPIIEPQRYSLTGGILLPTLNIYFTDGTQREYTWNGWYRTLEGGGLVYSVSYQEAGDCWDKYAEFLIK